jgi:alkanesulfonate monooxygenase SsuD/methylene tetrahydromethanopterin reductase-like flavin-dependent oxidoreductase (luciferase family)
MTAGTLQVDLLLDSFGTRWSELRDAASVAVDAGFRGIWTYDHLDGRVYDATHVLECWTVLSALGAVVPSVALGPMVLNVANRHPGMLATMAATLQDVCAGRLLLGLGAGAHPGSRYAREQEAIGRPVFGDTERREQVEQCVVELHRIWQAPGFLHPDPPPPIVIAAFGPKMAALAGRLGDGINTRATHPRLRELVTTARRASRDPDSFLVTVMADFDERWLSPDDAGRRQLDELGTHRLVLALSAPFDRRRIAAARPFLDR